MKSSETINIFFLQERFNMKKTWKIFRYFAQYTPETICVRNKMK